MILVLGQRKKKDPWGFLAKKTSTVSESQGKTLNKKDELGLRKVSQG